MIFNDEKLKTTHRSKNGGLKIGLAREISKDRKKWGIPSVTTGSIAR